MTWNKVVVYKVNKNTARLQTGCTIRYRDKLQLSCAILNGSIELISHDT
jgi:hypothetical protein